MDKVPIMPLSGNCVKNYSNCIVICLTEYNLPPIENVLGATLVSSYVIRIFKLHYIAPYSFSLISPALVGRFFTTTSTWEVFLLPLFNSTPQKTPICSYIFYCLGFHGGSGVKNLSAVQKMQETRIQSLGQEDPLEKEQATHFRILAWRIP